MQSEEVKMRFGRCPYCRAMIYQNSKAVIFYCSRCRTPIRGKNPEPTDEAEYALSRLEILSADTASVFSDEPEDVGSDRCVDEVRPLSRRTRRPSSSSDWTTTTTTDSERSEEAFYTPRNAQEGRRWQSPSPVSSQELGASGGGGLTGAVPPEPGAVAAARLMDPAFHKELLHALDNLRSLIVTIEQPPPQKQQQRRRRWTTRIRCGECQEVLELSLPAGVQAHHRPIRTCSAPLVSDHHRPLLRRLE